MSLNPDGAPSATPTQPGPAVPTDRPLPVLPVRNQVLLPGNAMTVDLLRPSAHALVDALGEGDAGLIAVFVQRDPAADETGELEAVGVLARAVEVDGAPPGTRRLQLEGLRRVTLGRIAQQAPHLSAFLAVATGVPMGRGGVVDHAELCKRMTDIACDVLPGLPEEVRERLGDLTDLGHLSDQVGTAIDASVGELASLLQSTDVGARARRILQLRRRQLDRAERLERALIRIEPESSEASGGAAGMDQVWPLAAGGPARVRDDVGSGRMTEAEGQRLLDFAEKGYVIWEGLVEPELVDAFVADVADIRQHPGRFLTTDHRSSHPYRYSGSDFDSFESVLDSYVNLESARRVCFHPEITRFLEQLFDARPVAFQQLLFQRSNAHPLHQDTAVVCVQQPLLLAASWIALEDVQPGRGELVYYEGSHRIPDFGFEDGRKQYRPGDDPGDFSRYLVEQCAEHGCEERHFLAKKGDVFVWSADLVHGSADRTRPLEETRRSCVTHYCPENAKPLFFWLYPEHRQVEAYGEHAFYTSSHYRLPVRESPARPHFYLPLPS